MDRIFVQTGFRVRIVDGIEENRLMYLAVSDCIKDQPVDFKIAELQQDFGIIGASELVR